MSEGKTRLGRFDKWGYKNNFSKGELARELVYINEDNDNLKQALIEIREYVSKYAPIDKNLIISKIDKVRRKDNEE